MTCPHCASETVEVLEENIIPTGDGTPVRSTQSKCQACGWIWIQNEVL